MQQAIQILLVVLLVYMFSLILGYNLIDRFFTRWEELINKVEKGDVNG